MVHQTTRLKNIKNDPISRPSNPIRVMGSDGVIAHAWLLTDKSKIFKSV